MLGAIIWRLIGDRVEKRVKEAEDYATVEVVRRWEREGEIARECMRNKHELEHRPSLVEAERMPIRQA